MFTAQRPHLLLATALLAGALTTLGACGNDAVDCGEGQAREVDGERYCLYPGNLIIEGFKCPSGMLPNNVPGGVVCAPQDHTGSPLPDPLQAPFDDTVPWCVGDDCSTPPPTTEEPPPPPTTEEPPAPTDELVDCGEGKPRDVEGVRYCVYKTEVVGDDIMCPSDMILHEVPRGIVCAPQDQAGSALPESLQKPFGEPTVPCVGDECSPPPPLRFETFPEPRSEDDFIKIYRHKNYACVIDKDREAHCWGPTIGKLDHYVPKTLSNVDELALTNDQLCFISSGQVGCVQPDGSIFVAGFMGRMTYRNISTDGDIVCALGDYSAPFNLLHCGHIRGTQNNQAPSKIQGLINEKFEDIDITASMDRSLMFCGVREDLTVQCREPNRSGSPPRDFTKTGVYAEVKQHYGAAQGIACANHASRGPVDCWSLPFGEPLRSPLGRFSKLYSAYCGFSENTQEVQCWLPIQGSSEPASTKTLYQGRPRAFAVDAYSSDPHWCAIDQQGQIICSDTLP